MKYVWLLIIYLLPGVMSVFLVGEYGLLSVGAVLAVEALLMLLHRVWNKICGWGFHAVTGALIAAIGIVIGALLYPVRSDPAGLGIAASVLTAIVHAGIYLVMHALFRRNNGSAKIQE